MIEIRPLTTLAEMQQAEAVQRHAWNMDDLEITSVHTLHALQHNGAALIGAFADEKLVGFCLGVLGVVDARHRVDQMIERLKMYSVMAAVLPDYQGRNIGQQLKLAQRDFCLDMDVSLITWTYDPLEGRNAYFNIAKLGAVCRTYHLDFHGDLGGINAGLPTDRFEVEWWVMSSRVVHKLDDPKRPFPLTSFSQSSVPLINATTWNQDGWPVPPSDYDYASSSHVRVEIPANFQALKQHDISLAQQWRMHTRVLFTQLFHDGFFIIDFIAETDSAGKLHGFYLLAQENPKDSHYY